MVPLPGSSSAATVGSWIIFLTLVTVAVASLVRRQRRLAADVVRDPRVEPLHRAYILSCVLGLALGAAGVALTAVPRAIDSRYLALAPGPFGLILTSLIAASQLVHYRRAASPGVAGLESRGLTTFVTRRFAELVASSLTLLMVMLGVGALTAAEDSFGHRRTLAMVCDATGGTAWFSPYPGSYYGAPLAISLLVLAAFVTGAVALIARRPRNASDERLVSLDNIVRTLCSDGVVAGLGLTVGLTMIGVGFLPDISISDPCLSAGQHVLLGTYLALCLVGILLTYASLKRMFARYTPHSQGHLAGGVCGAAIRRRRPAGREGESPHPLSLGATRGIGTISPRTSLGGGQVVIVRWCTLPVPRRRQALHYPTTGTTHSRHMVHVGHCVVGQWGTPYKGWAQYAHPLT